MKKIFPNGGVQFCRRIRKGLYLGKDFISGSVWFTYFKEMRLKIIGKLRVVWSFTYITELTSSLSSSHTFSGPTSFNFSSLSLLFISYPFHFQLFTFLVTTKLLLGLTERDYWEQSWQSCENPMLHCCFILVLST